MNLALSVLLAMLKINGVVCFTNVGPLILPFSRLRNAIEKPHFSTPFDASFYDDDEESANPFTSNLNSLAVAPNTEIVLGLNKYSHDTTLCAADASSGKVLFAMSKERLTRKKHDSGNVATLVEECLDQLELDLDNVVKVVVNNHHHRVLPMEASLSHMEWETGLGINGGSEGGYTDEENLLYEADLTEISHHLAHAYSAACQAPFNDGLVMVMDGMGETYRSMKAAIESKDERYVSDILFEGEYECIPNDISERSKSSVFDWREAESAYEFKKSAEGISVKVSAHMLFDILFLLHAFLIANFNYQSPSSNASQKKGHHQFYTITDSRIWIAQGRFILEHHPTFLEIGMHVVKLWV
jgi:hypothetical protein